MKKIKETIIKINASLGLLLTLGILFSISACEMCEKDAAPTGVLLLSVTNPAMGEYTGTATISVSVAENQSVNVNDYSLRIELVKGLGTIEIEVTEDGASEKTAIALKEKESKTYPLIQLLQGLSDGLLAPKDTQNVNFIFKPEASTEEMCLQLELLKEETSLTATPEIMVWKTVKLSPEVEKAKHGLEEATQLRDFLLTQYSNAIKKEKDFKAAEIQLDATIKGINKKLDGHRSLNSKSLKDKITSKIKDLKDNLIINRGQLDAKADKTDIKALEDATKILNKFQQESRDFEANQKALEQAHAKYTSAEKALQKYLDKYDAKDITELQTKLAAELLPIQQAFDQAQEILKNTNVEQLKKIEDTAKQDRDNIKLNIDDLQAQKHAMDEAQAESDKADLNFRKELETAEVKSIQELEEKIKNIGKNNGKKKKSNTELNEERKNQNHLLSNLKETSKQLESANELLKKSEKELDDKLQFQKFTTVIDGLNADLKDAEKSLNKATTELNTIPDVFKIQENAEKTHRTLTEAKSRQEALLTAIKVTKTTKDAADSKLANAKIASDTILNGKTTLEFENDLRAALMSAQNEVDKANDNILLKAEASKTQALKAISEKLRETEEIQQELLKAEKDFTTTKKDLADDLLSTLKVQEVAQLKEAYKKAEETLKKAQENYQKALTATKG